MNKIWIAILFTVAFAACNHSTITISKYANGKVESERVNSSDTNNYQVINYDSLGNKLSEYNYQKNKLSFYNFFKEGKLIEFDSIPIDTVGFTMSDSTHDPYYLLFPVNFRRYDLSGNLTEECKQFNDTISYWTHFANGKLLKKDTVYLNGYINKFSYSF